MGEIVEFMSTGTFSLVLTCIVIVLAIGFIVMIAKLSRLNKRYRAFMKKLGSDSNIEEDLETFMHQVEKVEKQNGEIVEYVKTLDNDLERCIQKIGIVRYNAFRDTGSNLSFSLALLDEHDNGVVLNGVYSREASNIYAKPVEKGKSSYALSDEEAEAIQKAMNSENRIKLQ